MKKIIVFILLVAVITFFSCSITASAYFSGDDYYITTGKHYKYEDNKSISVFNNFLNDFDIVFSIDLDYCFQGIDSTIFKLFISDDELAGKTFFHGSGSGNAAAYLSYVLTVIIDPFSSSNYFSYSPSLYDFPFTYYNEEEINRIYTEYGVTVENETFYTKISGLTFEVINEAFYRMFVPCTTITRTSLDGTPGYFVHFDYNDLQISVNSILRQLDHILYNTPFMILFDFDPLFRLFDFRQLVYSGYDVYYKCRQLTSGTNFCYTDGGYQQFVDSEYRGTKVNFLPKSDNYIIDYNVRMNFLNRDQELICYVAGNTDIYYDFYNAGYGIDNVHRFMRYPPYYDFGAMHNVGTLYIDGISDYIVFSNPANPSDGFDFDIDFGETTDNLFSHIAYPDYTFFSFDIPEFWKLFVDGFSLSDLPTRTWAFKVPKIWDLRILFNNALYYMEKVPTIKNLITPIYHITENVKLFFDDILLDIFDITDGSDYIGIFIIGLLALTIVLRIIL